MFKGRLNRRSYALGFILVFAVLAIYSLLIDNFLDNDLGDFIFIPALFLFLLFAFSFYIRRLHDFGFSGWWVLLLLIPLVNCVTLLAFLFVSGENRDNSFGPKPQSRILPFKELYGFASTQQIPQEESKPTIPNNL